MNYNSFENQEIKQKFVGREVYANISDMADCLFGFGLDDREYASYDDFENFGFQCKCPYCGELLTDDLDDLDQYDDLSYICPNCNKSFYTANGGYPDVLEWYIVSPWLGEMLSNEGEVVYKRELGYIWGRQISGQAVYMDYVISRICDGICILVDDDK